MDAGLPGVEFETHGRIASAVARKGGNRASSGQKQRISAFLARFLQLGRVKSDRLLGTVLQSQGRVQEAIHAYRQARQYQPDYADTHYWLGNALHQSGAMRDAIASYRQAIKLKPNFPEALGDLGAALLDLGEIEQAADLLQRALAMQPANPVINSNMSHALRLQGKVDQVADVVLGLVALAGCGELGGGFFVREGHEQRSNPLVTGRSSGLT